MWIVHLALRRPYTSIVAALLLLTISPIVILRTPTDIFPSINVPVVSIVWQYSGLSAQQFEGNITWLYERVLTTTVNDIEHVESQTMNGIAVVKVFFQPKAKVETAIAQVTAISQAVLRQLPPGITPPLIVSYNASSVPVLQLGLSGATLSEAQLNDIATNFIRPQLATVPGAAVPWPFGGKARQIMVDIDPLKLSGYGLSPSDISSALAGIAWMLFLTGTNLRIEWLRQELESPRLDGTNRHRNITMAGEENGRDIGFRPEELTLQLQAAKPRQLHIQHQASRRLGIGPRQKFPVRAEGLHSESLRL